MEETLRLFTEQQHVLPGLVNGVTWMRRSLRDHGVPEPGDARTEASDSSAFRRQKPKGNRYRPSVEAKADFGTSVEREEV